MTVDLDLFATRTTHQHFATEMEGVSRRSTHRLRIVVPEHQRIQAALPGRTLAASLLASCATSCAVANSMKKPVALCPQSDSLYLASESLDHQSQRFVYTSESSVSLFLPSSSYKLPSTLTSTSSSFLISSHLTRVTAWSRWQRRHARTQPILAMNTLPLRVTVLPTLWPITARGIPSSWTPRPPTRFQ